MQSQLRILYETSDNSFFKNHLIIKICSILVLLLISTSFGFMPYFITFCRKSNKFLSLSNSFSAGIFLGLGFFHILPEAAEMVHKKTEFPLAYVCCFLSYSLNLFVEKVVFGNSHEMLHKGLGHDSEHEKIEIEGKNESIRNQKHNEINFDTNENKEEKQILDIKINQITNDTNTSVFNNALISKKYEMKNTTEEQILNSSSKTSYISYLLLFALGFHGLFEGISLGVQQTIKGTLFLVLAIALHKWAASLTLGISFVKSGVSQKEFIINVLIFSFITPIGIIIGMTLTTFSSDFIAGIFLSISVGTFIYIACSEVVVDEFNKKENKYIKFILFILGAGIVLSLNVLEFLSDSGHGHNHNA